MLRSLLVLALFVALATPPVRAAAAPVLEVGGFATQAAVPPALGAQFADAIAGEARDAGGVVVVRGAAALPATQLRGDARTRGADDLLVGSIAPVGSAYAVLIQLVSVRTGLVAWSTTVQIASAVELHGIGAHVTQLMLDQAGRATFAATPAPNPNPTVPGGTAGTRPSDAAPPDSTYAVMTFGGAALPGDRAIAVRTVLDEIRKRGASAVADGITGDDVIAAGAQACMDTGAATIVGGTVDTARTDPAAPVTATVTLQAYDCRTQSVLPKALDAEKSAVLTSDAIRAAASAVAAAYLATASPPPHR